MDQKCSGQKGRALKPVSHTFILLKYVIASNNRSVAGTRCVLVRKTALEIGSHYSGHNKTYKNEVDFPVRVTLFVPFSLCPTIFSSLFTSSIFFSFTLLCKHLATLHPMQQCCTLCCDPPLRYWLAYMSVTYVPWRRGGGEAG